MNAGSKLPSVLPVQEEPGRGDERHALKCAFSTEVVIRLGTGVTSRKQVTQRYWFVEQKGPDRFDVSGISPEFVPQKREKSITRDELLAEFTPEVELYHQKVEPAMRALQRVVARADRHRARGESFSAEMEYRNALKIDSENVRATFGLGLIYLERGDRTKAGIIFKTLLRLEAAFEEDHKHLFNEFGISLRKSGLFKEAVEYYQRAKTISPTDEHLEFNLARAYYELGDYAGCLRSLIGCLLLDPGMMEAVSMAHHLIRLHAEEPLPGERSAKGIREVLGASGGEVIEQLKTILCSVKERRGPLQALLERLP